MSQQQSDQQTYDLMAHFKEFGLRYLRLAGLSNREIEQLIDATPRYNPLRGAITTQYLDSLSEDEKIAARERLELTKDSTKQKRVLVTTVVGMPIIAVESKMKDIQIADLIRSKYGTQPGDRPHRWKLLPDRR